MIKKIILVILCIVMLGSCGRKSDPQYEAKINFDETKLNELR
tara:strand:- start:1583 stop:1708 length:126 start_codon:yes stop_codon:yes gene_type:complete